MFWLPGPQLVTMLNVTQDILCHHINLGAMRCSGKSQANTNSSSGLSKSKMHEASSKST